MKSYQKKSYTKKLYQKSYKVSRKFAGTLALCLTALCLTAMYSVTPAHAAPPTPNAAIGIIDETRMQNGYTKYKTTVADIQKRFDEMKKQLQARQVLNEAEGKRFDELIAKKTRTAEEETALQNLVKSGGERGTQYLDLKRKDKPADADTARLKELEELIKASAAPARKLEDVFNEEIQKLQDSTEKEFTDRANDMIKQVAIEKKLVLVVGKQVIIYNTPAIDITDEVLARLNKAA